MILITGATGKLGSKVIDTLLRNNVPAAGIAAFVRDETKAADLTKAGIDIRIGDYDDKDSLDRAMQGVEKVLLVSGLDMGKVVRQHQQVVDAAKKAGVKCLAYTSNCLRDPETVINTIMHTHFQTENYIMDSGLNYIIFRNVLYMDSMVTFMLGNRVPDPAIALPAGEGRVSYALRSDQAEAIGHVLAGNDCSSRIYSFTNSRTYSFYDVAEALRELTGKPIIYTPLDMQTYRKLASQSGVPEYAVDAMESFLTDIRNGQGSMVSPDMEAVLGRKPTDLKTGLKQLLNL